jgi:hypothetical protein
MNHNKLKQDLLDFVKVINQETYYRQNIASRWLINLHPEIDRKKAVNDLNNLSEIATKRTMFIVEILVEVLEGKQSSWLYKNYPDLFIEHLKIITGERTDSDILDREREAAYEISMKKYKAVLEDTYQNLSTGDL